MTLENNPDYALALALITKFHLGQMYGNDTKRILKYSQQLQELVK